MAPAPDRQPSGISQRDFVQGALRHGQHMRLPLELVRCWPEEVAMVSTETDDDFWTGPELGLQEAHAGLRASGEYAFKRLSQRLNEGGCDGHSTATITPFWTGAVAVTGTTASSGAI